MVEGDYRGRHVSLSAPDFDEAVRAAAWAVTDQAFAPNRILTLGGRVVLNQSDLSERIAALVASGSPLV